MEKIKDLTKVKLPERGMLVEIKKPKRLIITPDGAEEKDSYAVIITCDHRVTDFNVGDIIIKYGGGVYAYPINFGLSTQKDYAVMFAGNVQIAVTPENFIDPDKVTAKISV